MPNVEEMLLNWLSKVIALGDTVFPHPLDNWRVASDVNDLIIISVPRMKVKAFLNARNSIPELLPAWLA